MSLSGEEEFYDACDQPYADLSSNLHPLNSFPDVHQSISPSDSMPDIMSHLSISLPSSEVPERCSSNSSLSSSLASSTMTHQTIAILRTKTSFCENQNFQIPDDDVVQDEETDELPMHMHSWKAQAATLPAQNSHFKERSARMSLTLPMHSLPLSEGMQRDGNIPRGINPISVHLFRRTQSQDIEHDHKQHDDSHLPVNAQNSVSEFEVPSTRRRVFRKLLKKIKRNKYKGSVENEQIDVNVDLRDAIKVRAAPSHKGPYDFDLLVSVQNLDGYHQGSIWCLKFSHCGCLLASGGQDGTVRIWVLRDKMEMFQSMRSMYSDKGKTDSPSHHSVEAGTSEPQKGDDELHTPFVSEPFCIFRGHSSDVLDLSWSKNYFLLSASMDKTVRLWHISRKECLYSFKHIDFVPCVAFHPKVDRYFVSGCLDGKVRLWSIPDRKVSVWSQLSECLITAVNFCMNGQLTAVGTFDGRCIFYQTDQMKYYTEISVRSTRGRNSHGRKITGLEPMPNQDKLLITSNDSRLRIYDLRDMTLTCKYKGYTNINSQIKAAFSQNGQFIISGSEDHHIYIWRTNHTVASARKDRNYFWESILAHNSMVTMAVFAPHPQLIIKQNFSADRECCHVRGEVIVSSDHNGNIRVFINKFKPGSGPPVDT